MDFDIILCKDVEKAKPVVKQGQKVMGLNLRLPDCQYLYVNYCIYDYFFSFIGINMFKINLTIYLFFINHIQLKLHILFSIGKLICTINFNSVGEFI